MKLCFVQEICKKPLELNCSDCTFLCSLYHIPHNNLVRTSFLIKLRFVIVGLWNTIFALSMFYSLLKVFDSSNYQLLLVICFLLANIQSHFMQRTFVWKSKDPYFLEISRFLVSAVAISLMNFLLLVFFVEGLDFPVFQTQVPIALALTLLNFFFQKHLVFSLGKK